MARERTDELGELWVSEKLPPEGRQHPQLDVLGEPAPSPFDGDTEWP